MNVVWKYATPVGDLWIGETGGAVSNVWFSEDGVPAAVTRKETPLLLETARQLGEYFAGTRKVFNVPLAPVGTDFQRGVWDALLEIPYGETRTYGQIAAVIGNPTASANPRTRPSCSGVSSLRASRSCSKPGRRPSSVLTRPSEAS